MNFLLANADNPRGPQMTISDMQSVRRISLVVLVAIMVAFSWLAPLDSSATERVDAGFKRALVSYAGARALNAIISIAQGTEMSFQALVFGLNLAPGQILDPLNNLVEQLSQLLLIASVALGIQKIFLSIGASWIISLVLTAIAGTWCALLLLKRPAPPLLSKLLMVLLMLRFAIPISLVGSGVIFQNFLDSDYRESQAVIEATSLELERAPALAEEVAKSPEAGAKKSGLLGRWFGKLSAETTQEGVTQEAVETPPTSAPEPNATAQNNGDKPGFFEKVNPKKKLEGFKQAAEKAVEHAIQLMVVFALDTIILPILLIWALISVGRGALVTRRDTQKLLSGK